MREARTVAAYAIASRFSSCFLVVADSSEKETRWVSQNLGGCSCEAQPQVWPGFETREENRGYATRLPLPSPDLPAPLRLSSMFRLAL
jgi:hypothetical protein